MTPNDGVGETARGGFRDECGVFGIYGHDDAARLTYLGLYQLQHRGQESCGIVATDGAVLRQERAAVERHDADRPPDIEYFAHAIAGEVVTKRRHHVDPARMVLMGPGEAKGELKRRLERTLLYGRKIEIETVDKMTEPQIIAKVREHFLK